MHRSVECYRVHIMILALYWYRLWAAAKIHETYSPWPATETVEGNDQIKVDFLFL